MRRFLESIDAWSVRNADAIGGAAILTLGAILTGALLFGVAWTVYVIITTVGGV